MRDPHAPIALKKVLVVEDDAHLRRVYRALLENEEFEVIEAADGVDGLSAAFSQAPACIIADTMMPRMDGLTMLSELKAKGVRIPTILVSAAAGLPEKEVLADLGILRVLGKPFPFDHLIDCVKKATDR